MPQLNSLLSVLSSITDPKLIVVGGEIPNPLAETQISGAELRSRPRHGVARAASGLVTLVLRAEPSSVGSGSSHSRVMV